MKKIIKNKLYDTETARCLGCYTYGNGFRDFHYEAEALYQKRTGEFFLYGEGGAASKYAEAVGMNEWSGGKRIMPLTYDEAAAWAEKRLDADDYIKIFGEPAEDDSRQTITLSLSAGTVAKAKQAAAKAGISLSAYIESLIQ
jgi:hypothetical protein